MSDKTDRRSQDYIPNYDGPPFRPPRTTQETGNLQASDQAKVLTDRWGQHFVQKGDHFGGPFSSRKDAEAHLQEISVDSQQQRQQQTQQHIAYTIQRGREIREGQEEQKERAPERTEPVAASLSGIKQGKSQEDPEQRQERGR